MMLRVYSNDVGSPEGVAPASSVDFNPRCALHGSGGAPVAYSRADSDSSPLHERGEGDLDQAVVVWPRASAAVGVVRDQPQGAVGAGRHIADPPEFALEVRGCRHDALETVAPFGHMDAVEDSPQALPAQGGHEQGVLDDGEAARAGL